MDNFFPTFSGYNTEGWGEETDAQLQNFLDKLTRIPAPEESENNNINNNTEKFPASESSPESFLDSSSDLATSGAPGSGHNPSPETSSPLFDGPQINTQAFEPLNFPQPSEEEKVQLQQELLARMEWSTQPVDNKPQSKRGRQSKGTTKDANETHKQKEKERREAINDLLESIKYIIPVRITGKETKVSVLQDTVEYVQRLQQVGIEILAENKALRARLGDKSPTTPPKSNTFNRQQNAKIVLPPVEQQENKKRKKQEEVVPLMYPPVQPTYPIQSQYQYSQNDYNNYMTTAPPVSTASTIVFPYNNNTSTTSQSNQTWFGASTNSNYNPPAQRYIFYSLFLFVSFQVVWFASQYGDMWNSGSNPSPTARDLQTASSPSFFITLLSYLSIFSLPSLISNLTTLVSSYPVALISIVTLASILSPVLLFLAVIAVEPATDPNSPAFQAAKEHFTSGMEALARSSSIPAIIPHFTSSLANLRRLPPRPVPLFLALQFLRHIFHRLPFLLQLDAHLTRHVSHVTEENLALAMANKGKLLKTPLLDTPLWLYYCFAALNESQLLLYYSQQQSTAVNGESKPHSAFLFLSEVTDLLLTLNLRLKSKLKGFGHLLGFYFDYLQSQDILQAHNNNHNVDTSKLLVKPAEDISKEISKMFEDCEAQHRCMLFLAMGQREFTAGHLHVAREFLLAAHNLYREDEAKNSNKNKLFRPGVSIINKVDALLGNLYFLQGKFRESSYHYALFVRQGFSFANSVGGAALIRVLCESDSEQDALKLWLMLSRKLFADLEDNNNNNNNKNDNKEGESDNSSGNNNKDYNSKTVVETDIKTTNNTNNNNNKTTSTSKKLIKSSSSDSNNNNMTMEVRSCILERLTHADACKVTSIEVDLSRIPRFLHLLLESDPPAFFSWATTYSKILIVEERWSESLEMIAFIATSFLRKHGDLFCWILLAESFVSLTDIVFRIWEESRRETSAIAGYSYAVSRLAREFLHTMARLSVCLPVLRVRFMYFKAYYAVMMQNYHKAKTVLYLARNAAMNMKLEYEVKLIDAKLATHHLKFANLSCTYPCAHLVASLFLPLSPVNAKAEVM